MSKPITEYNKQRINDFIWLFRNIQATKESIEIYPTPNMVILHKKLKSELEKWRNEKSSNCSK